MNRAGRLADGRDARRIAAEAGAVRRQPVQRQGHVGCAVRPLKLGGEAIVHGRAEKAASRQKIGDMLVERLVPASEAAAMNEERDGMPLAARTAKIERLARMIAVRKVRIARSPFRETEIVARREQLTRFGDHRRIKPRTKRAQSLFHIGRQAE